VNRRRDTELLGFDPDEEMFGRRPEGPEFVDDSCTLARLIEMCDLHSVVEGTSDGSWREPRRVYDHPSGDGRPQANRQRVIDTHPPAENGRRPTEQDGYADGARSFCHDYAVKTLLELGPRAV
jgi:hypothetical protein